MPSVLLMLLASFVLGMLFVIAQQNKWRFSLRTLLVGLTVLTFALGGLSYYLAHRAPAAPRLDQVFEP